MSNNNHLDFLDGLRGLAAFWVLLGHATHMNQWRGVPLLSEPQLAVDLFMLISGFLMYYHAGLRQKEEGMRSARTWVIFWTRRFFRIAPLFYVALAIAFLIGPELVEPKEIIRTAAGRASDAERLTDNSLTNIFLHISFLFGFSPPYVVRTALPDWSIGLEMQFYALFPLLFLMMTKLGPYKTCAIFLGLCLAGRFVADDYLRAFPHPGMIALKLNIFLSGMLIASACFTESKGKIWQLIFAALMVGLLPIPYRVPLFTNLIQAIFIGGLAMLALHQKLALPKRLNDIIASVSSFLGSRPLHFMGELSYGVYLVHLCILIPISAYFIQNLGGGSPPLRFLMTILVACPIIYATAYLLYRTIEKPGIALGRHVVARLKSPRNPSISAENTAPIA